MMRECQDVHHTCEVKIWWFKLEQKIQCWESKDILTYQQYWRQGKTLSDWLRRQSQGELRSTDR